MKLIDSKQIAEKLGLTPEQVAYRLAKRPDFPAKFKIGGANRWNEEEINDWIELQRKPKDGRKLKRLENTTLKLRQVT